MNNEKCSQCGKSMKDKRKGTKYCSDTCKQKAYTDRKLKEESPEDKKVFYLSHYYDARMNHEGWTALSEQLPPNNASDLDPVTYCFLANQMPKGLDMEAESDYIVSFAYNDDSNFDFVRKSKAFLEFKEGFLSGKFNVVEGGKDD